MQRDAVLDATQISTGDIVMMKKVSRQWHPYEVQLTKMLASEPLRSHPKNHCVPIIEILDVPDDPDLNILVMPLLSFMDEPRFETVGEVLECYRQILEVTLHFIQDLWGNTD